jgi:large subunit ribosomal protein L13
MTTFSAKAETVQRGWFLVDAKNMNLGRGSSEIARRLMGKHKPEYTPHVDTGDNIVVVNAKDVKVTGRKADQKVYYSHSGQPGNLKEVLFKDKIKKNPAFILEESIRGMLPKGPLGRDMFRKLKVYGGSEHPHAAQQPELLEI